MEQNACYKAARNCFVCILFLLQTWLRPGLMCYAVRQVARNTWLLPILKALSAYIFYAPVFCADYASRQGSQEDHPLLRGTPTFMVLCAYVYHTCWKCVHVGSLGHPSGIWIRHSLFRNSVFKPADIYRAKLIVDLGVHLFLFYAKKRQWEYQAPSSFACSAYRISISHHTPISFISPGCFLVQLYLLIRSFQHRSILVKHIW